MEKLLREHRGRVEAGEPIEVYTHALETHKQNLKDLEANDIQTLRRKIGLLKRTQLDLTRDLEEAEVLELSLLSRKDDLWATSDPEIKRLFAQCQSLTLQIEELKGDEASQRSSGLYQSAIPLEEAKALAKEMFMGCDHLHSKHMS